MALGNITRRDALGLAVGGIAALSGGILASTFHGDEALAADDNTVRVTIYKPSNISQNLPSLIENEDGEFGYCLHATMAGEPHDTHPYGQTHTVWCTYEYTGKWLTGRHAWYAYHCGYGCDLGLSDPHKSQYLAQYLIYNVGMWDTSVNRPVVTYRGVPSTVINDYLINLTGIPMATYKDRYDKCEAWFAEHGTDTNAPENRTFRLAVGPGSNADSWQPLAVKPPVPSGFLRVAKRFAM